MRLHEHDSGQRTSPERGRDFGQVWSSRIQTALTAYRHHYARLGIAAATSAAISEASCQALSTWHPGLGAELEAIADGAGIPVADLGLLNSRTEILAAAPVQPGGECSTVVRVPPDSRTAQERPIAFQTWDWHAHLVPNAALWRYAPGPGRWVKTFTEPGMLAKIGVNSSGLAVNFNILSHRADSAEGGVPVHAIARRILDEAATVREATDIARSARVSASTAITVLATGSGRPAAASLEITPAGTVAVAVRPDGWLIRTNHLLSPDLRAGDAVLPDSTSRTRYDHLDMVLAEEVPDERLPDLATRLCGAAQAEAPICMKEDLRLPEHARCRTMLTVRLDPVDGVIEYWPGPPSAVAAQRHAHRF